MEMRLQIDTLAIIVFLVVAFIPLTCNCLPLKENRDEETTSGHSDSMTVEEFVSSLNDSFPSSLSRLGTVFSVEGAFSCQGHCGFHSQTFCSCKPTCVPLGLCCHDFHKECKAEADRLETDLWWLNHITFTCFDGLPLKVVMTCPDPDSILYQDLTLKEVGNVQSTITQTAASHLERAQTPKDQNDASEYRSKPIDSKNQRQTVFEETTTRESVMPETVSMHANTYVTEESTQQSTEIYTEDALSVSKKELGKSHTHWRTKGTNDNGQPGDVKGFELGNSGGKNRNNQIKKEVSETEKIITTPPLMNFDPTLTTQREKTPTVQTPDHSSLKVGDYMEPIWDRAYISDVDSGVVFINESIFSCYRHLAKSPEYWSVTTVPYPQDVVNLDKTSILADLTKVVGKELLHFSPSHRAAQLIERCFQSAIDTCPPKEVDPIIRKGCLQSVGYISNYWDYKIYRNPFCMACNDKEHVYNMLLLDANIHGSFFKHPQNFAVTMKLQPNKQKAVFVLHRAPGKPDYKVPAWKEMVCTIPDYLAVGKAVIATTHTQEETSVGNHPLSETNSSRKTTHQPSPSHASKEICRTESCHLGILSDGKCIVQNYYAIKLPETVVPLCHSFLNNLSDNISKSLMKLDDDTNVFHDSQLLYKSPGSFTYQIVFTLTSTFEGPLPLDAETNLIFEGIEKKISPDVLKTDRFCFLQGAYPGPYPKHTGQCDPGKEKVFSVPEKADYLAIEDMTCCGHGKQFHYLNLSVLVLLYGLLTPNTYVDAFFDL